MGKKLFFVLVIFIPNVFAQKTVEEKKPIKIQVNRVVVPVTVTNEIGGSVLGLDKTNFEILEDKNPQTIISLEGTDSEISIGIILDVSGSMLYKWLEAGKALIEFLKTSNPKDEFFLVTFADRPHLITDFTSDQRGIQARLMALEPDGNTSLLDAIYLGTHEVKKGSYDRKALLIVSDGADNHSRYGQKEIKDLVKESGVLIYAIGIFNKKFTFKDRLFSTTASESLELAENSRGASLLDEITKVSGGKLFKFNVEQSVEDKQSLADIARKISLELRNQYFLTYRSNNELCDGKWRKIKVKLKGVL